jgi:bis(5'-nucleosyl)-tetraphosphatase (symmetrical)
LRIFAVGDVQGCLDPLKYLLEQVSFSPGKDFLWSVGDLVNRGPKSLETLRFCYKLGDSFRMVLGNHDLHLLAVDHDKKRVNHADTFQEILKAPDKEELLNWMRKQPVIATEKNYVLVHAGIPPQWSLEKALDLGKELSDILQCNIRSGEFFNNMYGNKPNIWRENLTGPERWRIIANYFTRMRYCSELGVLELKSKDPKTPPKGFLPWFDHKRSVPEDLKIIFGHWAALKGCTNHKNLYPLDTGYLWGGRMRLMNVYTEKFFHCNHEKTDKAS